jgi:ParB family chromosome partitioning protein
MEENQIALLARDESVSLATITRSDAVMLIEQAKNRLAVAYKLDDIKELRDKHKALLTYLKQKKDSSTEALHFAEEICARSELRIGELLLEIAAEKGNSEAFDFALASGISRGQAQAWLRAAKLVEGCREGAIKTAAASGGAVSLSRVINEATAHSKESDCFERNVGVGGEAYAGLKPQTTRTAWGDVRVVGYDGDEWFSPAHIVKKARIVLGKIDLDPCSCAAAQENVEAVEYFDRERNGLEQVWAGNVWLAPPYSRNLIARFTSKLILSFNNGNVKQAIALVNSYTDSSWYQQLGVNCQCVCLISGRLSFLKGGREFSTPPIGQTLFYFGSDPRAFEATFGSSGLLLQSARRP